MKLKLRKKKNKLVKVLDDACFNCGHPFSGHEKFCPECGQANKDKRITFGSFLHEVFNGFISWDSKFWTTFIPLLTKPGKVSRDYIDGKRQRYANPFRFYLSISVLFFLILGATESYDNFKELKNGKTTVSKTINDQIDDAKSRVDSIDRKAILKNIDSTEKAELLKVIPDLESDSIKKNSDIIQFSNIGRWAKFVEFEKKHPKMSIDNALDSLKQEKTFWNRLIYNRIKAVNSINNDNSKLKDLGQQIISYISISLFVLLPIFTLFLKFIYIRRKFTYVEHLIFVFHTQTVFFLLLTLFYFIYYLNNPNYIIGIFFLLFLVYLYLAMKRFYKQGHIKTFIKFIFINSVFMFVSILGFTLVTFIAFVLY